MSFTKTYDKRETLSSNRLESLFNVIYGLLGEKGIDGREVSWEDLDEGYRKILDEVMNGGIPRECAKYTLCEINSRSLCIAEFHDEEKKFTAHYLVYGGEIIYTNEF